MKVDNDIHQCAVNFPARAYFFKGSQPIKQLGHELNYSGLDASIIKQSAGRYYQYLDEDSIFSLGPPYYCDITLSTPRPPIDMFPSIDSGNNNNSNQLYYFYTAKDDFHNNGNGRWDYTGFGNISLYGCESVSSYIYYYPLSFRTSASFTITNGVKTQPASPTFWDSIIETERDRLIGTFPALSNPNTLTVSIITPTSGKLIEYKLLNYTDYLTVLSAASTDHTVAFYNSITSPTLSEAIIAGGCQYFGVLKITRKIAEAVRFELNDAGGSLFLGLSARCFDGTANSYSPVYSPLESDVWPHRTSNNYSMHLSQ